uniref:Protein kinase domain-containing protein n=1 Tax=Aegilops tauschii subsp. strangulata TaxID=200361 RepID=A0A453M9X3_AEGTS
MGRQASAARNDLEHMLSDEKEQPKALPLSLLEDITDGFSENLQIGRGGFAVVYKGVLENGTIAVKKLFERLDIPDNKFNEEIRCLMKVKHKNIVRFLGYCANTQGEIVDHAGGVVMADVRQRLLCFEYVPKGSLDEYIKDASNGHDWIKTYAIINGICEGLHYLHQNRILHLDLKPANILLDGNMMPKITDFGLSRCFDEKQTEAITKNMAGTLGYIAPEFHSGGDIYTITKKSDIYSLGVIIIEMLTGKKWYPAYPDVDKVLESWMNKLGKSQRVTQLKQIRLCIELGIECTDGNQANRPDTPDIINRLGETENARIMTGVSSLTVQRALEKLEDATKNLLPRRDIVHLMNDSAEKNVTHWQGAAKNLRAAQECLNDNHHIVAVESGPSISVEDCNLREAQECHNHNLHISAVESSPSMSVEDRNLQEALKLIKDDLVGVIGIWGPGGVGKTHLLNNIKNSLDGNTTFNYVVQLIASRGCSVEKIQTDIARHLNLNRDGNVESQSRVIFDFLKKRSFLVLLDDIWGQIDLQAVGIPYPLGYANQIWRKVVLTTRSRRVCGQMEVRKDLNVSCLHEDDSWQVFQDKVGHKTLFYSPRIEALARELVKEMKGLPLALITLGKAMYGKTDTAEWEYAIQHMRRSCCDNDDPLDMERIVFSQIKFSFDSLRNNTLRKCFLTCALWPEDQHIYKVELARCWIGLGLVHESDIHSSYTKAYSLMGDLSAACLLDGCGEMYDSFKMHDVVRDMALWISCGCNEKNGKWFVRAGIGRHENFSIPWSQVEFVSLMCNYVLKLPPVGSNPCHMRMLCLGNNWLHESILIEEIKKFTSLTYLDLRFNNLGEIPEELCSLTNLEHLDLSHNIEINEVPYSFGNLIKLKFLYLGWTSIQRIPEGVISKLQSLQVIDFNTFYLRPIPKDLLSRMLRELGTLPHLKAVGITAMCFSQYKLLRESEDLPIRSLTLRRLETRAFYFSDILSHEFAPRTLYELLIHMCIMEEIIFGHGLAEPNCGFRTLNQLSFSDLSNLREITWTKTSPASLFPRLACLDVHSCGKLNHLSWAMDLPCLEQLVIYDCSSMRQAFMRHHGDNQCSGQDSSKTFPCLRYLKFLRCESLVGIGDPDMTFPSLERLVLHHCPELNRLPFKTDNLPRKLQELQIDVGSWERLELEEGVRSFLQPRL